MSLSKYLKVLGVFALAVLLAPIKAVNAQEFDSTVSTAITTALGNFSDAAVAQFGALIPIALVVTISVAVVYFVIRHFRGMGRV